jgi:hypothetical protein
MPTIINKDQITIEYGKNLQNQKGILLLVQYLTI